jgi:putative phosphoribosyl transferase
MFTNREEAALKLSEKLMHLRKYHPVVLGIPRGGVVLGKIIADQLNAPLDVAMTKKIGHPENSELAVGAVSLETEVAVSNLSVPEKYFNEKVREVRQLLRERYEKYTGKRESVPLYGATAILVDDGIATGNTMLATIRLLREQHVDKVVVAVPLAPPSAARKMEQEADEFIVLETPEHFSALGQFYEEFHQLSDEEVIALLND